MGRRRGKGRKRGMRWRRRGIRRGGEGEKKEVGLQCVQGEVSQGQIPKCNWFTHIHNIKALPHFYPSFLAQTI